MEGVNYVENKDDFWISVVSDFEDKRSGTVSLKAGETKSGSFDKPLMLSSPKFRQASPRKHEEQKQRVATPPD